MDHCTTGHGSHIPHIVCTPDRYGCEDTIVVVRFMDNICIKMKCHPIASATMQLLLLRSYSVLR